MMKINNEPLFETEKVIELYSKKDGVDITYVCTTALNNGTIPVDVFYRETPHPEFGNRYFGLYYSTDTRLIQKRHMMITNADCVENFEFGMIEDSTATWHYSQHRHDFRPVDDCAIDGGRAYIRVVGGKEATTFVVKDGKFVKLG
jgi:hypothetical protein